MISNKQWFEDGLVSRLQDLQQSIPQLARAQALAVQYLASVLDTAPTNKEKVSQAESPAVNL